MTCFMHEHFCSRDGQGSATAVVTKLLSLEQQIHQLTSTKTKAQRWQYNLGHGSMRTASLFKGLMLSMVMVINPIVQVGLG